MKTIRSILLVLCLCAMSVGTVSADTPEYHAIDLGTLGGFGSFSADINDHGQIVGAASTVSEAVHAFISDNGV
ncbi:MAG: hypothetical protein EHM38_07155, partial [Geobacteraceae bacterium]